MELFDIHKKVILITGGYGYLGSSIVKGVNSLGAKVYVLGRNKDKFKTVFGSLEQVEFIPFDLFQPSSYIEAFKTVYSKEGKIDVLINNAFALKGQDPLSITDNEWDYSIEGTLTSVYRTIREVVPFIEKSKGSIINIASMYGMIIPDFNIYKNNKFLNPPHYGIAKAGVIHMTKYFAAYLGDKKIRVNTISPGPFPSNSVQEQVKFVNDLVGKTALGRIGKPEDLWGAVIFLCSDASSFVTGINIPVDGGWTIK